MLELPDSPQVGVSIICNAYNHESFIATALDGFVLQQTNFAFEVLVHDDATTDNTANIIREYEKKYQDIIKPIYQTVNQYSQHNGMISKLQFGRAKGKYIALCEGDDYWTDPLKLQKQYDAMEVHPELDMCAHAASKVREGKTVGKIAPRKECCVIAAADVIRGGGAFFATNSLFYRKSMRERIPEFYQYLGFDYSLQIWGSLRGGILYLPDNMSVYRLAVPGSWTVRMGENRGQYIEHKKKVARMYEILAGEVDDSLVAIVNEELEKQRISTLMVEQRFGDIKREPILSVYKKLPLKYRMKVNAKQILHYIGLR